MHTTALAAPDGMAILVWPGLGVLQNGRVADGCVHSYPCDIVHEARRASQDAEMRHSIASVKKVSDQWRAVLFPAVREARSNNLARNETMDFDSQLTPWSREIVEVLSEGPTSEPMFGFSYPEFLQAWRMVLAKMPVHVVPCQARHSGASLDAARGYRTRKEITSRGRWQSQSSVQLYEKHSRVAQSMTGLDPSWQAFFGGAANRLEALYCGQTIVQAAVPPLIQGPPPRARKAAI